MTNSLNSFIAHASSKGMDLQTVRLLLLSAGWKEKDISAALASETLDMPVPVPTDGGGARDAFFHLLTFTTLYSTVIATIVLLFQYLNRLLPDAASNGYVEDLSGIRWSLAVVMVSFPLFMFFSRILHKEFIKHTEKLMSGIRKWLTYLTLFVTACTLIGDVITLFFYLLDGELSTRFILKVLAVLLMSGLPFWYYFSVIRMESAKYEKSPVHKIFFGAMTVIIPLVFLWGIVIVGSPTYGRQQRFDELRISHLRQINEEILNQVYGDTRYAVPVSVKQLPKPLPNDLATVAQNAQYQKLSLNDPETGLPYEYAVRGTSYDLCATFGLELDQTYEIFWNHPAGHHCFTFDALDSRSK